MISRRCMHISAAGALLLGSGSALAQAPPTARDPAAAEALFRGAQDALDRGDWAAACAKFEASMGLDPAVSTLINIAKCRQHEGKLATAWAELQRALVMNGDTPGAQRKKDLETYTKGLIAALEPRLPKLEIVLRDRPAGIRVTRDGLALPLATVGEALPVDPGPHEIVASAPGFRTETRTVSLDEGKRVTIEIALVAEAPPATSSAPTPAPVPALPRATSADVRPTPAAGGIPTWTWIVGGAGVALAGAAAGFRIDQAIVESDIKTRCGDAVDNCPPKSVWDPTSANARKNRDAALFVGFTIGGAAAIGAAIIGIVRARKSNPPPVAASVWVLPGAAGVAAGGRF